MKKHFMLLILLLFVLMSMVTLQAEPVVSFDGNDWNKWSEAQKFGYVQAYSALTETLYSAGLKDPGDLKRRLSIRVFQVTPWGLKVADLVETIDDFYSDSEYHDTRLINLLLELVININEMNGYKVEDYIQLNDEPSKGEMLL